MHPVKDPILRAILISSSSAPVCSTVAPRNHAQELAALVRRENV